MIRYSDPPILLRDVIEDVGDVVRLLERNAPYTPLGGWYRPGADLDVPTSPMWFQNDWVHADLRVDGSELFLFHERVTQAARDFYAAEVIVPHSVYVNLMAAIDRGGPAHTDNPRFHGRDRSNTPMWLLRTMLWSGLFDRYAIVQATSIWWMNDVEGGGTSKGAASSTGPRVRMSRRSSTWATWRIPHSSATTTACSTRWAPSARSTRARDSSRRAPSSRGRPTAVASGP
jgi:hypothetical protein